MHAGPIRSLSLLPSLGFMSTSNDGTVRVWSLDGDALAVVGVPPGRDGQAPFVYKSVALAGGGGVDVAAVGEEPAAFVWRGQVGLHQRHHYRRCSGVDMSSESMLVPPTCDGGAGADPASGPPERPVGRGGAGER